MIFNFCCHTLTVGSKYFEVVWKWKIEEFSHNIHVDGQSTSSYSHAVCVCFFFSFFLFLCASGLETGVIQACGRPHRRCAGQRPTSRCTCPWRSLRWPAGGAAERRGRSWETWGWSGWSGISGCRLFPSWKEKPSHSLYRAVEFLNWWVATPKVDCGVVLIDYIILYYIVMHNTLNTPFRYLQLLKFLMLYFCKTYI